LLTFQEMLSMQMV